MMTLDEIISNAEYCANEYKKYSEIAAEPERSGFRQYEEEHIQLAEWLKDYKRLKEQEPSETIHGSTYGGVSWGGTYKPQQPCEDAISREDALMALTGEWTEPTDELIHQFIRRIRNLPSVNPQPKMGQWILTQRDKCVDIRCSECGNTRFKEYAYTINELNLKEINDLIAKIRMNYCECCGAKMQEVQK